MIDAGSRTVKLTRADEHRAEQLYGWKWRQFRRWVAKGEKAGDPCPFREPAKMPAWVTRHSSWRVPEIIEATAVAAAKGEIAWAGAATLAVPTAAEPATEKKSRAPEAKPPQPPGKPINLEDFDPEEGDRLRELRQIQAARFADLKSRLAAGEDATVAESKYLKLCETVDKIESRVTERLKKRGLYILRDVVDRDRAAAAELLRQSRVSMSRRVLELCPSLDATQRAEVVAAIERTRSAEERILARLDTFQNGDDLLRELHAA